MNEYYAMNGEVGIHYFDSMAGADEKLAPVVVCPGLSETAEEYVDLLQELAPRRCILLSFRGRGKSDTPKSGYNLAEHVADIEAVIESAGLTDFHLFGFSRGVSYALGFAHKHSTAVRSLIVGDYPPEHRSMPDGWAEDYIHNYLIPFNRTANIRQDAVWGIQRESMFIPLNQTLPMPLFVGRGQLEGSLIDDTHMNLYRQMSTAIQEKQYARSGHALESGDKKAFYRDVNQFIGDQDKFN
ncbi:alpha/beta fold hydrolase [Paenibacillus glycanilyticus]|nr:alpha/beta fold hydrolase [Paenibacillus glycanilyticus]